MADKNNMKCNKPQTSDRPGKKKMVKACSNGEEKLIHYGADGYKHNYSKEAKKSFRARHGCDSADDKLSAKHWACKDLWPKNKNNFNEGGIVEEQCQCENCKAKGGIVKGPEIVKGDSLKNDVIKANLSAGEMIIPKSIVNKGVDAITKFAKDELNRKNYNQGGVVKDDDFSDLIVPDEESSVDESSTLVNPNKISEEESLLKGSQQGVTFGAADELQGLNEVALDKGMAFLNRLSGGLVPKSPSQVNEELKAQGISGDKLETDIKDIYSKARDEARREYKKSEEANPGSYLLGNIAGGVLVPGASLKGLSNAEKIKRLSQMGALTGSLTSEADLTKLSEEEIAKLTEDIGTGTALGAGFGALSTAVGAGASKLKTSNNYLGDLLNAFRAGKGGNKLNTEKGRKFVADQIIRDAAPIGNEITDELSRLGKLKNEAIESSSEKIDISNLEKVAKQEIDKLPKALLDEDKAARKILTDVIDSAKSREVTIKPKEFKSGSTLSAEDFLNPNEEIITKSNKISVKDFENLRSTLGKLGYKKDLKDDDIINLAKRLSGKSGEMLPENIKEINKELSPLIKAAEMLGIQGDDVVSNLTNTKKLSPLIDRLEKEGLQGSLSRNQLDEVVNSLKKSNPALAKLIEDNLSESATRFDLTKKLGKADFDVTKPLRSIPDLGLLSSNILGQAASKAGLGGFTNKVLEKTPIISQTINASDIKKQEIQPEQKVEVRDLSKDQLKNITSEYANDPKYINDIEQLNKALDNNDIQGRSAAIFKILQKNPELRQKLRGEK